MLTMEDPDDIHRGDTDSDNVNVAESPPVKEKEESFSSDDIPEESVDIADAMEKIGKGIDPENPKPLGE